MPRYYFHVVSPRNPVRDVHGVELAGLDAAHWHAMHLVYRLREHVAEAGEDWVIEVSDETGARPLVVLPRAVPMLREARTPTELGGSLSNLGGDQGEGDFGRVQSRDPPHLLDRRKPVSGRVVRGPAVILRRERSEPRRTAGHLTITGVRQNWVPAFAGMTHYKRRAATSSRCRRGRTASAPENPAPRP
jgi:hypothetical protein